MAAPSFAQIQSFTQVGNQLQQLALEEFMEYVHEGMTYDELLEIATELAGKYAMFGCELGAQWYDLCTELSGIDADPAELPEMDADAVAGRAKSAIANAPEGSSAGDVFKYFLQNEVQNSIRVTGSANLWRDYERGLAGGRWARVPVGETCAWCLMLASQGAWYVSEQSALGAEAGHYHDGCDCIAVYHADPDSISGYRSLRRYKSMYYEADNLRRANSSNREPYPEELQERVTRAKDRHAKLEEQKYQAALERGEDYKKAPWTVYNEDLIVMRYKYGLK